MIIEGNEAADCFCLIVGPLLLVPNQNQNRYNLDFDYFPAAKEASRHK